MKIIAIILDVMAFIVAIIGYFNIPEGNKQASNWCVIAITWIFIAFLAHIIQKED